ncbi:hypothetical protein EJ110_NYTH13497 [Nymphaea thermarum]|nr:hypothetical protein EJ110_NYTH13497 [Nymphaea thermarum]
MRLIFSLIGATDELILFLKVVVSLTSLEHTYEGDLRLRPKSVHQFGNPSFSSDDPSPGLALTARRRVAGSDRELTCKLRKEGCSASPSRRSLSPNHNHHPWGFIIDRLFTADFICKG